MKKAKKTDLLTWRISFDRNYYVLDSDEYTKTVHSTFFRKNGYSSLDLGRACMLEIGESCLMDDGYQVVTRIN